MRKLPHLITGVVLVASTLAPIATRAAVQSGDRIKMICPAGAAADHPCKAVYYYGGNSKRYVFPNDKTYFTWYSNFTGVKEITATELGNIPIGGNVTYKAGVKMVKITTDPKVYAVSKGGVLRWIQTESVARSLYGTDWNKQIDDVPDPFFVNYTVGDPVVTTADYNPTAERDGVNNINEDKNLATVTLGPPNAASVTYGSGGYSSSGFAPSSVTIAQGGTVTWTNNASLQMRVSSNPHPTHTNLPGFDSPNIEPGGTWSYTFTQKGNWGYHNHLNSSFTGVVVVE